MPDRPHPGDPDPDRIDPAVATRVAERSIGLFLLGVVAFSPPLVAVFAVSRFVLGIPLLYLYVFGAWAVIVALVALIARQVETAMRPPPDAGTPAGED
jgi:hypothetical protein